VNVFQAIAVFHVVACGVACFAFGLRLIVADVARARRRKRRWNGAANLDRLRGVTEPTRQTNVRGWAATRT
jgi:hypothetical protein